MAGAAFDLDLATAENLLTRAGVAVRPTAVTRLTGGDTCAVFELRSEDGVEVAVKLYSDLLHWNLQKELFVYELVRRLGERVPVPAVLAADDSKTLVPRRARADEARGPARLLPARPHRGARARFDQPPGRLLPADAPRARVRRVRLRRDGRDRATARDEPRLHRFQFAKKLRQFEELGGDADLRRRVEQHVAERDELLAGCDRPVLCHDDCHSGNVLVVRAADSWRASGVLDFENAVAGDPLLDLAKTYCYSPRTGEELLAALVAGYGDLRTGWREAINVYVVYHLLELWTWLAQLGRRDSLPGITTELRGLVARDGREPPRQQT